MSTTSSIQPAERRQVTILFCDMVASTALSLRLDPEELAEVIQKYRQRCADLVARYDGMVARYIGDGVLALFGYPRAHEDDAERAIRAALNIAKVDGSSSPNGDLSVHIGIATGVVVVGNLPQSGEDISTIGIAPNLAARLEGLADPGTVVVSEQTRNLTRGLFEYRDLGQHNLKGFDQPVRAWQVIGERRIRSRFHALRASALTPLVDRQNELEALRRLWHSARVGQGQAVLLTADPGVGKSRLAEVVAKEVVDGGCLRLWHYGSATLHSSPLAPLIRQLTFATRISDGDDDETKLRKLSALIPAEARDVEQIVPLLADLLSIRYQSKFPPLTMSPQRQKQRLFQALMRLLEGLTSRGPLLVVVEDLHWIDPSTDELIGILIDRLRTLPVLAILTSRPQFQSHWDDKPHLHHMPLQPLGRSDSVTMIGLLCGNRDLPKTTIEQIAEKADGLPLFIEDLTQDVLESVDLRRNDGDTSARDRPSSAIPMTLNDSLMSRLDRLGTAKKVAQVGAVIGREFSFELLAKVVDLTAEHLREELYRLVDAGLLIGRRSTAVMTYAFKHALVRDAAYSSLLKRQQVAIHTRIARSLIDDFPDTAEAQPDVVAYHLAAANDVDGGVTYLVKAAKLSARRSGFVEAIAQLEHALTLLAAQPKSAEKMRQELNVYRTLGGVNAEYRGFSSEECGRAFTKALEICRELGDAREIFPVLSGLGSFEITRANFRKCKELGEECLTRAALQQSKSPFIMGHLLLGGTLCLTGELESARKHLEEALALYEQDRPPERAKQVLYVQDQKSTGLCYLALTLTIMGDVAGGFQAAETGLAHSQSLGGLHTMNYSLAYLAAVYYIGRNAHAAVEKATQSLECAREQGFATWSGISQTIRGGALVQSGQWEEGLAEVDEGIKGHNAIQAKAYQPFSLVLLAEGLMAAGRLDEALDAVSRGIAMSESTGERFYAAELLRLKGTILAQSGRVAEAAQCMGDAIELARRQQARLFELRSVVSLCRLLEGSRRQAVLRDVLAPVCDAFGRDTDTPDVNEARSLLAAGS